MNSVNRFRVLIQNSLALRCSIFKLLYALQYILFKINIQKPTLSQFLSFPNVYLMLKYNRYAFSLNFNDEDIFFCIHNEGSTEQHTYTLHALYILRCMYMDGRHAVNLKRLL